MSVLTVFLTYRTAQELFGARHLAASLAAAIVAVDLTSVCFASEILTEAPFTMVMMGALLAHALFFRRPTVSRAVAAAALITAATLIRPISYYLTPAALLLIAVYAFHQREKKSNWYLAPVAAGLVCAIGLGGWQLRNLIVTGESTFSSIQGHNMLFYRAAGTVAVASGEDVETVREQLAASIHPDARPGDIYRGLATGRISSQRLTRRAASIILRHPGAYLRVASEGLIMLVVSPGFTDPVREWTSGTSELGATEGTDNGFLGRRIRSMKLMIAQEPFAVLIIGWAAASLLILWLGFPSGIISAWRERAQYHTWGLTCLTLFLVYFMLVSAGPEAYSRFRVPIAPLIAIFSAYGYATIWKGRAAPGSAVHDETHVRSDCESEVS